MGRKHIPGLVKRGLVWHINKTTNGQRICESTGTGDFQEAERYLVHRLETIRQAQVYGIRPKRTFREAALKFVRENEHKRSLHSDVITIRHLDPFIGHLPLDAIHMGSLQPFIEARRKQGRAARTINSGLQLTRHILRLAASEWMDEYGLTWLVSAPKIKLLPENDKRPPQPLSWEQQDRLFLELPEHLALTALFTVNTGCRDQEVCQLRWEWEVAVPELGVFVFIIPGIYTKNGQDRLVVLNQIALSVIEAVRGRHPEYVFTYRNHPMTRMLNSGWKTARQKVGLELVRVHDLRHTFGRRLRAAGVSEEDRQDLLGHKNRNITTHYSAAEIGNLIKAANKVCERSDSPTIASLKKELCQLKQVKVICLQSRGDAKMTQAFGEGDQKTM